MARLVRMDHTGHTSWRSGRSRRPRGGRGRGRGVPPRAGPRLLRDGLRRARAAEQVTRAAGRRRPRDHAAADLRRVQAADLPERAAVHWRPRVDERAPAALARACGRRRRSRTSSRSSSRGPCCVAIEPCSRPSALALVQPWAIPELYAQRRRERRAPARRARRGRRADRLGLLGDLVGHEARDLHARTGLVLERGRSASGSWGRRGRCSCGPGAGACTASACASTDPDLPPRDRISHLLLALRTDEQGFATVANRRSRRALAVRRRLPPQRRPALDAAVRVARG